MWQNGSLLRALPAPAAQSNRRHHPKAVNCASSCDRAGDGHRLEPALDLTLRSVHQGLWFARLDGAECQRRGCRRQSIAGQSKG